MNDGMPPCREDRHGRRLRRHEPKNLIVPIGTPVGYVIEQAGGFEVEPGKVILGGPMMGKCVSDLNAPVIKATNAVLAFDKKDSAALEPPTCASTAVAASNCPPPSTRRRFAKAIEIEDEAERYAVLTKEQVSSLHVLAAAAPMSAPRTPSAR